VIRRAACGLAAVATLAVACSSDPTPPPAAEVTFPRAFLWGSATAAFQVEKGLAATDWGIWVRTPGKIKGDGDPDRGGADALANIDADVALLTASRQNAYRFSIDWARIYPTRAAFDADQPDPAGVAAYDKLFAALRAANITPMVTLQHFTLPEWLSDPRKPEVPQGWERAETIDAFAIWCRRASERWGGQVDWWATINEPMVSPLAGYIQGSFPPGLVLEVSRALTVGKNEAIGHARCFDAIKEGDKIDADGDGRASWVGIVKHQRAVEPADPSDPADQASAERVRYVNNFWFLNVITRGDWDDDFDGKLDGPLDRTADPSLAKRSDYLGINYYSALVAGGSGGVRVPVIDAVIRLDNLPTSRAKTDFHWDIYPSGLATVLDEARAYGLPIVVTENGIADSKDANRSRFLLEHLFEVGRAMERGIDIRGYFHWSLLDNFEWSSGYCPKFGFHAVDPVTGARTARPSVRVYEGIINKGRLSRADVDAAPPYAEPSFCE
jgi:beta-glucosidase